MIRHSFSVNSRSRSCCTSGGIATETPLNGFVLTSLLDKAQAKTVLAAVSQMSFATTADL